MCKLRRKLLLFDYIISRLVEWQACLEYGRPATTRFCDLSKEEINACLKSFSGVRLMKMLYLICLNSVNEQTQNIQNTLFGLFDNYVAMPKGPVEDAVYSNRSVLLRFEFSNGVLKLNETYPEHFIFNYPDIDKRRFDEDGLYKLAIFDEEIRNLHNNHEGETTLGEYKEYIDTSIQALREKRDLPFQNVNKLIDITHKMLLWNKFFNTEDRRFVLTLEDLKKEKDSFKNLIS